MSEELYVCQHPTLGSWKCVKSQLAKTQGLCPVAKAMGRNVKVTNAFDYPEA